MKGLPPPPSWLLFALARRKTVVGASVCLAVAALYVASFVPLEWSPSVGLPEAMVFVSWPGSSPEQMEREVTAKIERALRGVPSGGHLESTSQAGTAFVRLELQDRQRLNVLFAEIADRLAALQKTLPENVHPVLERRVPDELADARSFMTLEVRGFFDEAELRRLAVERLEQRLRSVPGVARVTVEGGRELEIFVELDPARLETHRVSPQQIRAALVAAAADASYGNLTDGGRSRLLLSRGIGDLEAIENLPVAAGKAGPLRLSELGTVEVRLAESLERSRISGASAITLRLEKAPDSPLLEAADAVHARLAEIATELPAGVLLQVAEDHSKEVRLELRRMTWATLAGFFLVLLILLLSLPGLRSTAVVLLASGLSGCVALALMAPLGITFNLVTLAGLALVFGLLVDNALVVVLRLAECHHKYGASPASTALALREVALPLLGCTLTTAAVFFPLAYLQRELRELFVPFGWVVACSLLFSLFSALFLVPVWAGDLGREAPKSERSRLSGGLQRFYGALSRRPGLTLVGLLLLLGLPTPLLPARIQEPTFGFESEADRELARRFNITLGSELGQRWRARIEPLIGGVTRPFLEVVELGPKWDFEGRNQLQVMLELPPGSDIDRVDVLAAEFESRMVRSPAVEKTFVRILGERAFVRARIQNEALLGDEPYRLRQELIDHALGLAGCDIGIHGLVTQGYFSGVGTAEGLTVEAKGPSYEELSVLGRKLAARLQSDLRVAEVDLEAGRNHRQPSRELFELRWDHEAAARSGLSAQEVGAILAARLDHLRPDLELELDGRRTGLRLGMQGARRLDFESLLQTPLAIGEQKLPLGGFLSGKVRRQPPVIERIDQQYRRYFRILYRGPFKMGKEAIEKAIEDVPLPIGFDLELQLGTFFTEDVQRELFWLLGGAAFAIVLVMAVVAESIKLPLVTLAALPMGFVGVALGFVITEAPIAEGAFLGFALLAGLLVNHGILLMDQFVGLRRRRPAGRSSQLARLALRRRITPMWATTASSIAGLLPILFAQESSDLWRSLAITVSAGLLSSALLMPLAFLALLAFGEKGVAPRQAEPAAV